MLSDLRVEQSINSAPVRITFTLDRDADVTVQIARHLARGWKPDQWQYEYLAEPFPVRTLNLGPLQAGTHSIEWNDPVTETRITYPLEAAYRPKPDAPFDPDNLTEEVPVQLFRVTVQAGKTTLAANFKRSQAEPFVLAPWTPGNVFLDDAPAILQLYVCSTAEHDEPVTVEWTLTDIDGKETRGQTELLIRAMAQQSLPLVVDAPVIGHYTFRADVRRRGESVAQLQTQLARIRSRSLELNPDSPFSVGWGNNCNLMGLAGVKFDRVGLGGWDEPQPGAPDPFPDLPEAIQVDQSRFTGYFNYAQRWGITLSGVLGNSEPYLDNAEGPIGRIYSLDAFYRHVLDQIDRFHQRGWFVPEWHFWNEPNFFWFAPKEFYALVSKHLWSIVKTRDKDALYAADGDAGSMAMMEHFAECGANRYADVITIHYPGNLSIAWNKIIPEEFPEAKVTALQKLLALRDRAFPGRQVWNTEEGWWGAKVKTPETGARAVPRTFLPQLAAGVDQISWFAQSVGEDPTMLLRESDMTPWPAYCAYAAMTFQLEGADYAGAMDLGEKAFALLFAKGDRMILAAWCMEGEKEIALDAGIATDFIGREKPFQTLSERVQYVTLPRNDFTLGIARTELRRQLDALQVTDIPAAIRATTDLTRLFYLVQAAKQTVLAGEAPKGRATISAKDARHAILEREGEDGYLRDARIALSWTERLARKHLDWAVEQATTAAIRLAQSETPVYPGVVVNAYIGEPGEIARIRSIVPKRGDTNSTVDEKFRPQIARKPGDAFELELTVWNYYRHDIEGVVAPRLPDGWKFEPAQAGYAVEPGQFRRFLFHVTIPSNAATGLYSLGGQTNNITEIHAQRVEVR